MFALFGLELPAEDYRHALIFFGGLTVFMLLLAVHGRSFGLPLPAPLNRDAEQLRYWLDEAQRPGSNTEACLSVASIHSKRLAPDGRNEALRLRYEVATSRQHQQGEPGGR